MQSKAICGDNGSGKSTLIRGILGDTTIVKTGTWQVLKREGIGYLDQHYSTLDRQKTVLDIMFGAAQHRRTAKIIALQ